MPLTTLNELEAISDHEYQTCVAWAQQLSKIWDAWKKQHDGKMTVTVEFFGERERAPGVHASEISGCRRKMVYSLMGTKRIVKAEDKDVGMQRRFDMGTMAHALLQHEFHLMCAWYNSIQQQAYLTFEEEVSINPDLGPLAAKYQAHSSCDGRFVFWIPGTDANGQPAWVRYVVVGLEIKTSSDGEFKKLKEAKKDHKEQTCFYMTMLDIPLMWVLYYNKNNQHYTDSEAPFLSKYNYHMWKNSLEPRIIDAMEMAKQQKLPPKQEGMPCGWCPFAWTCQPNYLKPNRGYGLPVHPKDM